MDGRVVRALQIANGPHHYPRFRSQRWQFNANGPRYPLFQVVNNAVTMTPQGRIDMDTLLSDAIQIVVNDGARLDDIAHIYINANGLDQPFAFNPAGQFAVTYRQLLNRGPEYIGILNSLELAIQSGRRVVIDPNFLITMYAYSLPAGGTRLRVFYANDLIDKSRCVVRIKNKDNTCFLRCVFLSIERETSYDSFRKLYKSERSMTQLLELFSERTGWDLSKKVSLMDMNHLSDLLRVVVHIFDVSNGNEARFIYHSENHFNTHVYLLYNDDHFNLITNVQGLLRTFSRTTTTMFCTDCCSQWDSRTPHRCERDQMEAVLCKKRFKVGSMELPHFPYIGENREDIKFVIPTDPKQAETRRLLYLDFETYVQGYHRTTKFHEPRPSMLDLPARCLEPYVPYEFVERNLDGEKFSFEQIVNWCEIQTESGEVFTFSTLDEVMEWLALPMNNRSIVIAHCGGSFDFQFIFERFLRSDILKIKGVEPPLLRGNKIVKGYILNDIQLLDSYSFVTCALEKFPSIFGLGELKKGFFPHTFNRPEFWGYVGPIPSIEYYQSHLFRPSKREEFLEWHAQRVQEKYIFNFRKDMTDYCHSDVTLLREGMTKFRQLFMGLETLEGRSIGVDPFNYITIAGVAFDGVYRTYFLPENTIQIVPRPTKDSVVAVRERWLEVEESKVMDPLSRLTAMNERWKFGGVEVDAVDLHRTTAYVFHSCFYEGCTRCYNAYSKSPHRFTTYKKPDGKTVEREIRFGEIYAHTMKDMESIRSTGVTLIEEWECVFNRKVESALKDHHEEMRPLVPRDAYFGGRVNAVKLYYRATGDERIHYVDVTSMYPSVMSLDKYFYPIGQPTVLKKSMEDVFIPLDQLFGLMKCRVLPPSDLYHPLLPRRFESGKVLFDLEPVIGTWTHIELQRAVENGYVILDVYEQHHFPNTSNKLFKDYNETFFAIKRQAKLDGNKGLESIAKMCINAPTGKWGFNPSKQKRTELITDSDQFFRYLTGDYEAVTLNILNQDFVLAAIQDSDHMTEHHKSNVYISAFITAYARVMLIDDVFLPLGDKVLYYDTDSAIYVSPQGDHLLPVNKEGSLGTWASELPDDDYFVEFCSSGPKTYSCRSFSGDRNVNKSKGFHLHWENSTIFHMESMKEAVEKKALNQPFEKLKLHVNETMMKREAFHINVINNPGKTLNMTYDKRYICLPEYDEFGILKCIDTLPWGHMYIPEENNDL